MNIKQIKATIPNEKIIYGLTYKLVDCRYNSKSLPNGEIIATYEYENKEVVFVYPIINNKIET